MHACPHVTLHFFNTPRVSSQQKKKKNRCPHTEEFSVLFLLTFTNFIFNWLSTRTRRRARLTTSNWAYETPERNWALTKSFYQARTPETPVDTHTQTHTHKRQKDTRPRTKRYQQRYKASFPFLFFFSQESFSFISISMPAKLPSVLYYLFYFKRKERVCLVQTIPIPSLSLRKFSAKLRHAQFICK